MHALLLLLHTSSMLPMLAVCVSAVYADVLTILILLSTPGWFHLEQPVGTERASDASRHPELVGAGEGQAAGSGLHPPAPGLWPRLSDNHAKRWERHVCCFMHIARPELSAVTSFVLLVPDGRDFYSPRKILWRPLTFTWLLTVAKHICVWLRNCCKNASHLIFLTRVCCVSLCSYFSSVP